MSFAVVRMQKMKSHDLKGIQFHNQRERDSKTNPDIDEKKSDENYDLVHERKINYNEHVKEIIESQKTGARKTRKDAVLVNELLVTSDRTFFDKLNPDETKKFFRESLEIFEEKYGKQNIAYATVHMDEKTPHMHVGVVPMREGRLQGKNVFNRQELLWLQDKFPQKMKEKGFDLERGQSGSEREHLSTADFKLKMQKENLEQDIGLLEKEISSKKNELSALNEKIPDEVIVPTKRQFKKVEFESQEKNIFGRPKKEIKKEPTGNLIVTEQDFKKLVNTARNNKQLKGSIEKLLNTDLYQQNKYLKAENAELEQMNHSNLGEMVKLSTENEQLKSRVKELTKEIQNIYQVSKDFFEKHTNDLEGFKKVFKAFVDKVKGNTPKGEFKRTHERDSGFNMDSVKQMSEMNEKKSPRRDRGNELER